MQVEIRADRKSMVVRGYVNVVGRDSRVLHDKQGPYTNRLCPEPLPRRCQPAPR